MFVVLLHIALLLLELLLLLLLLVQALPVYATSHIVAGRIFAQQFAAV